MVYAASLCLCTLLGLFIACTLVDNYRIKLLYIFYVHAVKWLIVWVVCAVSMDEKSSIIEQLGHTQAEYAKYCTQNETWGRAKKKDFFKWKE